MKCLFQFERGTRPKHLPEISQARNAYMERANYCCVKENQYSNAWCNKGIHAQPGLRRFTDSPVKANSPHHAASSVKRHGVEFTAEFQATLCFRWYRQLQRSSPALLYYALVTYADKGGNTITSGGKCCRVPKLANHWRAKINELNGSSRINLSPSSG